MNDFNYQWDAENPAGYNNIAGKYKTKTYLNFIFSNTSIQKLKILDIGGGSGRIAIPLIKKGFDVTIVDKSKEAILMANKRNIPAFLSDVLDFNKTDFDAVIAIEVVIYFSDLKKLFDKVNQFLKIDGSFIFTAHNKLSIFYRIKKLFKIKSSNSVYTKLSIQTYNQFLECAGFEVIKIEGFKWVPFSVGSNNKFIPFFSFLEKILCLKKLPSLSPQLLYCCRKIKQI